MVLFVDRRPHHHLLLSAVVYWRYHRHLTLTEQQRDRGAGVENEEDAELLASSGSGSIGRTMARMEQKIHIIFGAFLAL